MMASSEAVHGRTAVVTGGGTGLGRAISRSLVEAGARVIAVGRRREPLEALAAELGDAVRIATCDVADPAAVEALVGEIAEEDVSILVNNAGIGGPVAHLVDIDPVSWDEVFAINVRGTFLMCRALLPAMIERGSGDVINLASVSGKRPLEARTPYCASKMAVLGLTSTLAVETGPSGVRVNALSPGPVESERMTRNLRLEAERRGVDVEVARQDFVGRAALGRMVTEEEVAAAVLAILAMPGMTGADVDLSAGMIA
ncbi:MAG: SDR family oxidoreductase [Brachybacterium sp.]|nr:SDR family oxidoreductase [Brachybacterium sp.]